MRDLHVHRCLVSTGTTVLGQAHSYLFTVSAATWRKEMDPADPVKLLSFGVAHPSGLSFCFCLGRCLLVLSQGKPLSSTEKGRKNRHPVKKHRSNLLAKPSSYRLPISSLPEDRIAATGWGDRPRWGSTTSTATGKSSPTPMARRPVAAVAKRSMWAAAWAAEQPSKAGCGKSGEADKWDGERWVDDV